MKQLLIFYLTCFFVLAQGQTIVIDAGHGWGADNGNGACVNTDTRLSIEMEASHSVAHKLKNALNAECDSVQVYLTRPSNACNSWVSLSQRTTMANSWDADLFLSIHTNAFNGVANGTETFYCANNAQRTTESKKYSDSVQKHISTDAQMVNRRSVEDASYTFHLYVLANTNAHAVLNEMGFGDHTGDYAKLASDSFRTVFANAYLKAIKGYLDYDCAKPNAGTLNAPIVIKCNEPYFGNTVLGTSVVNNYSCGPQNYFGKEKYHQLTVVDTSLVTVKIDQLDVDLDLILLNSIQQPQTCLVRNDNTIQTLLYPGNYYFTVEGFGTTLYNQGTYRITASNCRSGLVKTHIDTLISTRDSSVQKKDTLVDLTDTTYTRVLDSILYEGDTLIIEQDTSFNTQNFTSRSQQQWITTTDTLVIRIDTTIRSSDTLFTHTQIHIQHQTLHLFYEDSIVTYHDTTIIQKDTTFYFIDTLLEYTDTVIDATDTSIIHHQTLLSHQDTSTALTYFNLQGVQSTVQNRDTSLFYVTSTVTILRDTLYHRDTIESFRDTLFFPIDTHVLTTSGILVNYQPYPTLVTPATKYLSFKTPLHLFNARLYNLLGQNYTLKKEDYFIHLPELPKGLYVLELYNASQRYSYKIIKID